ncbi:Alpha/Beta hydrolase protein [Gloeopeniophorella convolvens]|nr:Alpha/Beta hydrolase protein [Gloeopeniophorella convolvens]
MTHSHDPVLAGPPQECCVRGFIHTGEARGEVQHVGNLQTYVSYPPGERQEKYKHIILYFSDVFSPLHINNQLLIDQYASQGYLVISPDYFEGELLHKQMEKDPQLDILKWMAPKRIRAFELVPIWFEAAKVKFGTSDAAYAAAGYCFGAPDTLLLAATEEVKAVAIVHPTGLNESHFKNAIKPVFISSNDDFLFPRASRHRAEEILLEKGTPHHLQVFAGAPHGFGTRGDPNVPMQRWVKEASANGIVSWFDKYVKEQVPVQRIESMLHL